MGEFCVVCVEFDELLFGVQWEVEYCCYFIGLCLGDDDFVIVWVEFVESGFEVVFRFDWVIVNLQNVIVLIEFGLVEW